MPVIDDADGGRTLRITSPSGPKVREIMQANGFDMEIARGEMIPGYIDFLAKVIRHVDTGYPKYVPNPRRKITIQRNGPDAMGWSRPWRVMPPNNGGRFSKYPLLQAKTHKQACDLSAKWIASMKDDETFWLGSDAP